MAIALLENIADLWRRGLVREADYSLSGHEETGGAYSNGWVRAGGGQDDELAVDIYEQMTQSFRAYRLDPRAKNIIETYVAYIMGDGYSVKFDNEADAKAWKEFKEENGFDEKFTEAVRLMLVRGEHFFRLFGDEFQAKKIRHLDATQVGDIETADGDPEEVTKYIGRDQYYGTAWGPDELIHLSVFNYGQKRGHSILEPILSDLAKKRKYQNAQAVIVTILASLPIIRKGPWTTEQIAARRNDFAGLPPPGAVVTASNKEDWSVPDHPAARMNWRDQGRSLDLSISAGVGLPYYMVFEDSSDSNYSATLVAEAPAMRRFNEIQRTVCRSLEKLVKHVVNPSGEFKAVFYPIAPRDTEAEVRAWSEPWILQGMSWQTWAEKVGIDPEEEEKRMRDEGIWPPRGALSGLGAQQDAPQMPSDGTGGQQWRSPTKDIVRKSINTGIGAQNIEQ